MRGSVHAVSDMIFRLRRNIYCDEIFTTTLFTDGCDLFLNCDMNQTKLIRLSVVVAFLKCCIVLLWVFFFVFPSFNAFSLKGNTGSSIQS